MSEPNTMIWHDGRIGDDAVVGPRPWSFIAGVLLLVVLADQVLSLRTRLWPAPLDVEVHDVASLREQLDRAATDPGQPYLLIGDSVLAGDVMRGKVADWEHHRVIDAMRAAINPESDVHLHQVALDALLPIDIQHVIQELDAVDPGARVPVVIELNPRYFSRSYADLDECTRPWLCEVGPTLVNNSKQLRWDRLGRWFLSLLRGTLDEQLPVFRHRGEFGRDLLSEASAALVPEPPAPESDALSARARLLTHYQHPVLRSESLQIRALEATVARLRATGRRAVFFTTPLEDEFAAEALDPPAYSHYISRMASLVEGGRSDGVTLVNFDHPLFASPLFLDHCHLGPEGNRRLALNLLVELDVRLAEVPGEDDLVNIEGADRTLVSRIDQGSADGASWQALFDSPRGVAVAPKGDMVVVADTGNHCLRRMTGALQTVVTMAGAAQSPGDVDGKRLAVARLRKPRSPVIVGGLVYFADQDGKALKVVDGDVVRTLAVKHGPRWKRIHALAADGQQLLMLDAGRRILAYDPTDSTTRDLVVTAADSRIKAFATTPDGRIFVADESNRIWVGELSRTPLTLGPKPIGLEIEFRNTGAAVMPQSKGVLMPFEYDEMRLANVIDMVWVERYAALLVQDDIPMKKAVEGLTERIQLRMFQPEQNLIYPWLKPLVHGGGYFPYNKASQSFSSYFHVGSMAIDQATATLFWLEENRSRLFHFGDGAMGVAKIGHIAISMHGSRDVLQSAAGAATLEKLRPDQHLGRRIERHHRDGPYVGFIIGSSMVAMSNLIGSYSLGVIIEERLNDLLGYQDGIRFHMIQRSYAGVRSPKVLQELHNFVDTGVQPDVIFIELTGAKNRFFESGASDERMREILADIDAVARRSDAMVVFIDNAAIGSVHGRDGLRAVPPNERRFEQMARDAGFEVIETGDELLRDALELSPWGSPPYRGHHAAPWAMDVTGALIAERVYPALRDHLRGRLPGFLRPELDEADEIPSIATAFAAVEADWAAVVPAITDDNAQSELVGDELQIFVDLGRIEVDESDVAALEWVATGALYTFAVVEPAGARARSVHVRLARFSRYDEYGAGVRGAAQVVLERRYDRDQLVEFLRGQRRRGGAQ